MCCAAALVLGELKSGDPAVHHALRKALRNPNESVRLYAAEALAKTHPADAIPHLLPFLSGPEPNRSRAVRTLAMLGPEAAGELRRLLGKSDAAAREGILDVLGRFREVDTTEALFSGLLDADPDVARQAATAWKRRLETLDPAARRAALRDLLKFMASPRVRRLELPLAHALRIVGAAGDPAAAGEVLRYLDRRFSPSVRAAALEALARLPLEGKVASEVTAALLPLVDEKETGDLLKPVLEVLGRVTAGRRAEKRLLKFLRDPRLPVRLYALQALGAAGSPAAAGALVEALMSGDPQVVTQAEAALGSNPRYVPILLKALERRPDPARAWKICNVLRSRKEVLDPPMVRKLVSRGLDLLDRQDPGAPAVFEVLRSAAPDLLREALLKRGRDWMRRGKFEEAGRLLGFLHREDLATPETELALAAARLRLQRLDLASARHDEGGAVQTIVRLARVEGFSLSEALPREVGVSPAVLLYVGFVLAERQGKEREVGMEILRGVARKYPHREEGRVARMKLRTHGAGPGEGVRP